MAQPDRSPESQFAHLRTDFLTACARPASRPRTSTSGDGFAIKEWAASPRA
ncbi:hypothetical protein [Streptomyces werraensis]|uniref:hypothetical protein n=1 Tax=Streptomyces werraensis TaxID=68284 RepID=UPI0033B237F0